MNGAHGFGYPVRHRPGVTRAAGNASGLILLGGWVREVPGGGMGRRVAGGLNSWPPGSSGHLGRGSDIPSPLRVARSSAAWPLSAWRPSMGAEFGEVSPTALSGRGRWPNPVGICGRPADAGLPARGTIVWRAHGPRSFRLTPRSSAPRKSPAAARGGAPRDPAVLARPPHRPRRADDRGRSPASVGSGHVVPPARPRLLRGAGAPH